MRRLTDEQLVEMRKLYEHSRLTLPEIAQQIDVSQSTIQIYARKQHWRLRRPQKAPEGERPRRYHGQPCTGLPECPERTAIVARAWAAAHAQISEIETRMAAMRLASAADETEAKKLRAQDDARAIGLLVRTIKDLTALDRAEKGGLSDKAEGDAHARNTDAQNADAQNADAAHRADLAEELARRLDGLRARYGDNRVSGNAGA
jgi:hypothetical protein